MSDQTVKVVEDKTEQELAQEFVKEYETLCKKYGFQIVVNPAKKYLQDLNAWVDVLQTSVGRLPKK